MVMAKMSTAFKEARADGEAVLLTGREGVRPPEAVNSCQGIWRRRSGPRPHEKPESVPGPPGKSVSAIPSPLRPCLSRWLRVNYYAEPVIASAIRIPDWDGLAKRTFPSGPARPQEAAGWQA
jgi:hypothetical protein